MTRTEDTDPAWHQRLSSAGLAQISRLLDHGPEELGLPGRWQALTKPGLGGRQRWRWELTDTDGHTHVLYVKRYAATPPKQQWDRVWRQHTRHSRAWWEFRQAQALAAAHVPVPPAVAVAEQMRGPFEHRSVVLLEAVAGDAFDRVWPDMCRRNAPVTRAPARHELTVQLARFVAAFHDTGLCHRDLYLCHVFADLDPQAQRAPRFTLVDLARTHRPRWRRMRWIIKDLAQLDCSARQIGASRTDRWRFLRVYLGRHAGAAHLRRYAPRIVRKSNWILRQIERRQRRS